MVTLTQIICKPDTMVRMHAWSPPLDYYTDDAMTLKVKQEEPMRHRSLCGALFKDLQAPA